MNENKRKQNKSNGNIENGERTNSFASDVSNQFKMIFVLNDLQCANDSLNVRKLSKLGHKSSRAVSSQPTKQPVNDNYTNWKPIEREEYVCAEETETGK